jgi:hypothetical protein
LPVRNADFGSLGFRLMAIRLAMLTPFLAAALALQSSPTAPAPQAPPQSTIAIDDLPIEQAAAARCAIAFATVSRWQKEGDARGQAYPDIEAQGGREFFVQVMVKLIDQRGLTREDILNLSLREVEANDNPEGEARIKAMMPACELMKSAAGL